jgi:hypothetical protein
MRMIASCLAILAAACTTSIPPVAPEQFACDSDEPLASGELQCPESHWCDQFACRPRLGCTEPDRSQPGCDRGAQRRCDPVLNDLTTAVECSGGNHTITSTAPIDDACNCPDQGPGGTPLFCAHIAEGISGLYPLFVTQPGQALPTGQFGIEGENVDFRWCVRACADEVDCPASHTCRPAPLVTDQLLASPSSRHTIGVCYPNYLVASSSTADRPQPDPDTCLANEDCFGQTCQFNLENVADHPTLGIGAAWEQKRGIVAHCTPGTGALADPGRGCTRDTECKNGLCEGGKCQRPCNPAFGSCDVCLSREVERTVPGSDIIVVDTVHVCESS